MPRTPRTPRTSTSGAPSWTAPTPPRVRAGRLRPDHVAERPPLDYARRNPVGLRSSAHRSPSPRTAVERELNLLQHRVVVDGPVVRIAVGGEIDLSTADELQRVLSDRIG